MPDIGNVNLKLKVIEKYAKRLNCAASADVILLIGSEKIPAHRFILGVHSEFFQILLLGQNFKEATENEVRLNAPAAAFKMLLQYMYTGAIDLRKFRIQDVNDLLELSHRYGLPEFEQEISNYLCLAVDAENAGAVLKNAILIENSDLEDQCYLLVRMTIEGIYKNELDFSYEMIKSLMKQRSPAQSEIKWFELLQKCIMKKDFCTDEEKTEILNMLDLSKLTMEQLFEVISPSGLINEKTLFEAVKNHSMYKATKLYNWCIIPQNASVLVGENSEFLFKSGDKFACIGFIPEHDTDRCILIDLGDIYCFNHIKFVLKWWTKYLVKVSKDKKTWIKVIDFQVLCKAQQNLYFGEVAGRFIKIVAYEAGMQCNSFEALLIQNPPMQLDGFIYPKESYSISSEIADTFLHGFKIEPTISIEPSSVGSCCLIVKIGEDMRIDFFQPILLSCLKFHLCENHDKKYSYKVKTSLGYLKYEIVSDKSEEFLGGWQKIKMSPQKVSSIYIEATGATIGDELRMTVTLGAPIVQS